MINQGKDLDLGDIVALYQSGLPLEQVGVQVGKGVNYVWRKLKENGIPCRPLRKYFLDDDFFEVIDTESKAYWLGFLAADGGLRSNDPTITLNLASKDKDHVVRFKEVLDATYLTHDYRRIHDDGRVSYNSRLCVRSEKMHSDLISHGVPPRKSLILKPPIGVLECLVSHWIRGYFDGDGTGGFVKDYLHRRRVGITSTREVLEFIQSHLRGMGHIYSSPHESNSLRLRISVQEDVRKFADYIYKDATVYLERKRRILVNNGT